MSTESLQDIDLVSYIDEAKSDAWHAFNFLRETGTLSASWTFNIAHRIPGHDKLLKVNFPKPWDRQRDEPRISIVSYADQKDLVIQDERLDADTLIHVHTPYLSAWSLAQKPFPILYVAAQRHLLAREIPNHLDRTRSVSDTIRERLDQHPEWAPPPGLLESNGGANIWGRGILKTARLILFLEEAARFQANAEQVGGAQEYTPGALAVQWQRTGLLEKSKAYTR